VYLDLGCLEAAADHLTQAIDERLMPGLGGPTGLARGWSRPASADNPRVDEQTAMEAPVEGGWFSVRCVFRFAGKLRPTYEERLTLWRATGFEQAVLLAETEAREYASGLGDCDYVGFAQAYHLFDEPGHGAEVFSLMRDSDLDPERYLTAVFDTGAERQGDIDSP
jgi:hypothetical protein